MKKFSIFCLLAFVALCGLTSCNDDPESINNVPEVFVDEASDLLRTSAVLTGRIMAPAKASIQEHGFKVSTSSDFSSSDTQIIKMDGDLISFTTHITDLEIGETYFYAAYATNGLDEMISTIKAFTTPTRSEVLLSDFVLSDQETASFSARVSDTGGGEILSVGFCWSETNNPSIFSGEHSFATLNEDSNTFQASLPLEKGKKYYVRAFAESDITVSGSSTISYSREVIEYYASQPPTIKLTAKSSTTTMLSFSVNSTHAEQVNWLILPESELDIYGNVTATMVLGSGEKAEPNKTVEITAEGLLPETTYLIYAAAENQDGMVLSDPIEMTTSQATTATLKPKGSTVSTLSFTVATTNAEKAAWVILSPAELSSYGTVTAEKVLTSKNTIETNEEVAVTVENLDPKTTYTIYAAAEKEGIAVLSQKLEMTTTTAPSVTTKATAQHVTSLEFTVSTLNAEKAAWVILSPAELSSYGTVTAEKVLTSKNTIETNEEVAVTVENLDPKTTYTIYAAAEKEGVKVLSQKLEMTTEAAPTVEVEVVAQDYTSLTFAITSTNTEEVRYLFYSEEELTEAGEITVEKVLTEGVEIEVNKRVEIAKEGLEIETTYHLFTAAFIESVQTGVITLEVATASIPQAWRIYYTSTDGNIVEPNNLDGFGANIISNIYNNGQGSIIFDGPVTSIRNSAFNSCNSLVNITIPDTVTSIGNGAFNKCDALTAFYGKYASSDNRCLIVDKRLISFAPAGLTEYEIPNGVTSIGYAFQYCSNLTSVIIPNSVTSIENRAFSNCLALVGIAIPDSVTSIGVNAFWSCVNLTSIIIPESITSIGSKVFYNCSKLKRVYCNPTIPPVTITGTGADGDFFGNCSSDLKIYVPEESVEAYKSEKYWSDFSDYIYPIDENEGSETVPETWKIYYTSVNGAPVSPSKFDVFGANIVSEIYEDGQGVIIFDGEVSSIGDSAFQSCKSLISITVPDTVTSIGNSAFSGCSSLTNITIPDSVTSIGDSAFYNCTGLTSVTIPDGVTSIGIGAFQYCKSLISITIPDTVTSIGYSAFSGCSNLTEIAIPSSITSIGERMFESCSGLTSVTIPDAVTSIGNSAFYGCSNLTEIAIPNSITSIGDYAFYGCTNLTAFYSKIASFDNRCLIIDGELKAFASAGLTEYTISDNVASIGKYTFKGCTGLTSITIPDSVTSIGQSAFSGCSGLINVDIGNGVTSIGRGAFSNCSCLVTVNIPNSLTSIGPQAFNNCNSLTNITIPESVVSIGSWAFIRCHSLTSITIPDSVTSIGGEVFLNCQGLTAFYGKYASSDNRCLIIDGEVKAFAPAGLTEYTIPDGATSIIGGVFAGCSLESVTIPETLTSFTTYTGGSSSGFGDCSNLTSVYCRPTTPPTLSGRVFELNVSGRKIYVPTESVETYKSASGWSSYASEIVGYDF